MIRPTLTRLTAPLRGPTDTEDHINYFSELLHDVRYLMFYMDRNDNFTNGTVQRPGHTDYIMNNMKLMIEGTNDITLFSVPVYNRLYYKGSEVGPENNGVKTGFSIQSLNPDENGIGQNNIKTRIDMIRKDIDCINKSLK